MEMMNALKKAMALLGLQGGLSSKYQPYKSIKLINKKWKWWFDFIFLLIHALFPSFFIFYILYLFNTYTLYLQLSPYSYSYSYLYNIHIIIHIIFILYSYFCITLIFLIIVYLQHKYYIEWNYKSNMLFKYLI